ncbi:hypothetical protein JTE90_000344 [Oedothorax gibbosus]|uniref:Uncharacterized protein n=1 Tax=Oedothorax gibbosus TaxID=931172 RepID=A0AAV6U155_9ARAC|nr:hypothetical protein JTE90_000344 [Oedothorax gibbosus]
MSRMGCNCEAAHKRAEWPQMGHTKTGSNIRRHRRQVLFLVLRYESRGGNSTTLDHYGSDVAKAKYRQIEGFVVSKSCN